MDDPEILCHEPRKRRHFARVSVGQPTTTEVEDSTEGDAVVQTTQVEAPEEGDAVSSENKITPYLLVRAIAFNEWRSLVDNIDPWEEGDKIVIRVPRDETIKKAAQEWAIEANEKREKMSGATIPEEYQRPRLTPLSDPGVLVEDSNECWSLGSL
ncbi:hypothetical protein EDB87DRAFT_1681349 [Lactarius vividus]|nr:hypothetical protein EDB87DRAFT_1684246 [Lactarius vividus]KAH9063643.1 hypothetical protein EDB87DRAFT_1681349 [Lactarius vividus]